VKEEIPRSGPQVAPNPFTPPAQGWRRLIGRYTGQHPGPKFLCVGGIHGNEPSGVHAVTRVLAALHKRQIPFRGELVGIAGNLQALQADTRYLERDMNRMWSKGLVEHALNPGTVPEPAGPGSGAGAEWHEVAELHQLLRSEIDGLRQQVFLLDLHTSSADGVPFACVGDTLRNRQFSRAFPVPILLGLEEQLDGALLEYLNNRGVVTMGLEGGQHREAHSIDRHEAGVWIGLYSAGCFPGPVPEQVAEGRRILSLARAGLPAVLEILYRHGIQPGDRFQMRPGYENFTQVDAKEILACDQSGPVISPMKGRLMLPLYQGKGGEGFFVARRVRPFWLKVSAVLRHLRLDRLVSILPGVYRHPSIPGALIINTKVARWYSVQVFHLLGFRKRRLNADHHLVFRRSFDIVSPKQIDF
jgi:predicted deacylase